ncbi:acyl-CoA carboxylase epsilon subunit [Arthrobacter sp. NPDC093128]|uniref:acyl-CoA carboxylase epsilon subunit n=1 Tax=Arthrobacter sp. NPDC093128 TaxID=3154979 RepID=UPI0034426EED
MRAPTANPCALQITGNPNENELAAVMALLAHLLTPTKAQTVSNQPHRRSQWSGSAWFGRGPAPGSAGWKAAVLPVNQTKRI